MKDLSLGEEACGGFAAGIVGKVMVVLRVHKLCEKVGCVLCLLFYRV